MSAFPHFLPPTREPWNTVVSIHCLFVALHRDLWAFYLDGQTSTLLRSFSCRDYLGSGSYSNVRFLLFIIRCTYSILPDYPLLPYVRSSSSETSKQELPLLAKSSRKNSCKTARKKASWCSNRSKKKHRLLESFLCTSIDVLK